MLMGWRGWCVDGLERVMNECEKRTEEVLKDWRGGADKVQEQYLLFLIFISSTAFMRLLASTMAYHLSNNILTH